MNEITQRGEKRGFVPYGSAGTLDGALTLIERGFYRKNPRILVAERLYFGRLPYYLTVSDNARNSPDSVVVVKKAGRFLVGYFMERQAPAAR